MSEHHTLDYSYASQDNYVIIIVRAGVFYYKFTFSRFYASVSLV